MTPRDLLVGSAFSLTAETAGKDLVSLWGRGAVSRFDGREGDLSLDGEVASGMIGADWTSGPGSGSSSGAGPGSKSGAGPWTVGLMVSHARGTGGYRGAERGGTVGSSLTGVYPYGRWQASGRVSVWGMAGYGAGTLTLTPDGQDAIETDIDLTMAAAGLRGVVVEAPAEGGDAAGSSRARSTSPSPTRA